MRKDTAQRIAALSDEEVWLEFFRHSLEARYAVDSGIVPETADFDFMRSALCERADADERKHYR